MPLRNEDYSDRELLHLIDGAAGPTGVASADDVAAELGLTPDGKVPTPRQRVASRLSWMIRYGFLASVDPKGQGLPQSENLITITRIGRELMKGRLTAPVERFLEDAGAGEHLLAMRKLAQRGYIAGRAETATALRREWLHQAARRPR